MNVTEKLLAIAKQLAASTDSDHNEATSYPFWAIVTKAGAAGRGHYVLHAGIWFSRTTAENHLKAKAYNYPKTAFVYCFSGHESSDYRALLTVAREAAEE